MLAALVLAITGLLFCVAFFLCERFESSWKRWFGFVAAALVADLAGTLLCIYVFGIDQSRELNRFILDRYALTLGFAGAAVLNHLILAALLYAAGVLLSRIPTLTKFAYFCVIITATAFALKNTFFGMYERFFLYIRPPGL